MKSRYRVGSLSAGLLFIALGIFLLLQQWMDLSFSALLFTWWPLLLILLGVEILVYLRLQKNETEAKLGYDVLSIFIIVVISLVSLFLYSIKESGFLEYVQSEVISNGYDISTPPELISDLNGIERIVITGQAKQLNITASEEGKGQVSITSNWRHVRGDTREDAYQKVSKLIETKKEGHTLFISTNQLSRQTNFRDDLYGHFDIELPHDIETDIQVRNTDITLEMGTLGANWDIQNDYGSLDVWVTQDVTFNISAKTRDGNINESALWDSIANNERSASVTVANAPSTLQLTSRNGWINLQKY